MVGHFIKVRTALAQGHMLGVYAVQMASDRGARSAQIKLGTRIGPK